MVTSKYIHKSIKLFTPKLAKHFPNNNPIELEATDPGESVVKRECASIPGCIRRW